MDKLPFMLNHICNRRGGIHAKYGGNWQSGICPSNFSFNSLNNSI